MVAADHPLVAVLTASERAAEGRGPTVASVAAELGIEVWPAWLVTEPAFAQRIAAAEIDLLLNVHSLHIIDGRVLETPRIGAFNLHPGPLPEYAGLSVPSWAIYNGERRHGVTVHWMAPDVDAGPIAYAGAFEIGPRDTGLTLSVTAAREGLPLVARLLADAARDPGSVPAVEQDLARRHWYPRRGPHEGRLPWTLPASRVIDYVRASDYSPFPSPWGHPLGRIGDREVEIVRAAPTGEVAEAPPGTIGERMEGALRVAADDEWVLVQRARTEGAAVDPASLAAPGERFEPETADALPHRAGRG
jgi:methionyl-tRNA formyltransferase